MSITSITDFRMAEHLIDASQIAVALEPIANHNTAEGVGLAHGLQP